VVDEQWNHILDAGNEYQSAQWLRLEVGIEPGFEQWILHLDITIRSGTRSE
jgi:hypothetical protein